MRTLMANRTNKVHALVEWSSDKDHSVVSAKHLTRGDPVDVIVDWVKHIAVILDSGKLCCLVCVIGCFLESLDLHLFRTSENCFPPTFKVSSMLISSFSS